MKTAFDLPDELFTEVKIFAAKKRRKIRDVVISFLMDGLQRETSSADSKGWLENIVHISEEISKNTSSVNYKKLTEILLEDRR